MIKEIFEHRSIRKYKNTPVDKQIMDDIMSAATRASTSGNMQLYSIIVTTDDAIKKQLSVCHLGQPMVTEAPAVVTFCADIHRFSRWCELREATPAYDNFAWFMDGVIDALLAAQNVVLEAESHSLGICFLGTTTYNADRISQILNLPKGVIPVTSIVMGYPDVEIPLTDRLPLQAVVHDQIYHDYTDQQIDEIWSEREASPQTAELLKINELPNLARIFTERRHLSEDSKSHSRKYFELVKQQGFFNQ